MDDANPSVRMKEDKDIQALGGILTLHKNRNNTTRKKKKDISDGAWRKQGEGEYLLAGHEFELEKMVDESFPLELEAVYDLFGFTDPNMEINKEELVIKHSL